MAETKQVNFNEVRAQILFKLEVTNWPRVLRTFVSSQEFVDVLSKLGQEVKEGRRFTPSLGKAFRAFEECWWDMTRVVFVGQDPYSFLGVADGLAFSCAETGKEQPSLKLILDAVEKDYPNSSFTRNSDLTHWAQQGVLLLNTALTVQVDKPGTHQKIWEPFTHAVLDALNSFSSGVIFVFIGAEAKKLEGLIGEQHHKLFREHPAYAARQNRPWDHKELFLEINKILKETNNEQVLW